MRYSPARVLLRHDLVLEALMGRAAVADEFSARGLELWAGGLAGAGDGDEGIAGFEIAPEVCVEGERVPFAEARVEPWSVEGRAAKKVVRGVDEREGADEFARQAFALEARPGPCGVDAAEMAAGVELVRQLKVMKDAVDGLNNLHDA